MRPPPCNRALLFCVLRGMHLEHQPWWAGIDGSAPSHWRIATRPAIVPESVRVNTPLSVEFTTYAGGCRSHRSQGQHQADIRSYQYEYLPREFDACTSELLTIRNTVAITFAAVGAARVRVFGRRMPGVLPLARGARGDSHSVAS